MQHQDHTGETERALLELLIQAAPVGIALVDHEFRYLRVNERLAALNGLPVAEHIGRTAFELFPELSRLWEPLWRQVLTTGEPVIGHDLSAEFEGEQRSARVSYYPVRAGDGPLLGVGILVEETTSQHRAGAERERLLAAERRARAQAEAAVRVRDAFLSIAAHELKNPLASLLGQAQLTRRRAEGEGLSEATRRSLDVIGGQATRLARMIDDLLDLSRLEQGQLTLVRAILCLSELVRRVSGEIAAAAGPVTVSLSADTAQLWVSGDAGRLEQVISNLVSNAVRYSHPGGTVSVTLTREGQTARLLVSDQGIGIPAEALPRLFEPFYRAPNAESHHTSGIGIGLAIVHEIVVQHDGTIAVQSELGRGSSFTVALPLMDKDEG